MRISPNHPRLRMTALTSWVFGSWCVIHGGWLTLEPRAATMLTISTTLLGVLAFAIGVAFWLLSSDRRAGVTFDSKGLLLNLGHSSSFISWDNIETIGVSSHRFDLLAIGSRHQLGIKLMDVQPYIQSYEERLPASHGMIARGVRLIELLLRPFHRNDDAPLSARLTTSCLQTGYDVLIPEALLGGKAEAFAQLIESYRARPAARLGLGRLALARS